MNKKTGNDQESTQFQLVREFLTSQGINVENLVKDAEPRKFARREELASLIRVVEAIEAGEKDTLMVDCPRRLDVADLYMLFGRVRDAGGRMIAANFGVIHTFSDIAAVALGHDELHLMLMRRRKWRRR